MVFFNNTINIFIYLIDFSFFFKQNNFAFFISWFPNKILTQI